MEYYFIWSFEHNGWWKSGGFGYTSEFKEAGLFAKDDAYDIVTKANNFGSLNETLIPASKEVISLQLNERTQAQYHPQPIFENDQLDLLNTE